MNNITPREIGELTDAELMCRDIQRFISEQAGLVQQMAARTRRQAVRQALDEQEIDEEMQYLLAE